MMVSKILPAEDSSFQGATHLSQSFPIL